MRGTILCLMKIMNKTGLDYHQLLHHLSLIDGVGVATINTLFRWLVTHNKAAATIYDCTRRDLEVLGIAPHIAAKLASGLLDKTLIEREQEIVAQHAITILTRADERYPDLLAAIHAPPPVLYILGSIDSLNQAKSVALIGSRTPNTYGIRAVEYLTEAVVTHGWTTISGGARGIDTAVHTATLQRHGTTVAVIGSGLMRPYPHENKKLFLSIAESGGAIVSSYPLMAPPAAGNFPARNRIIAGLSKGSVVIQAAEKSGALITASCALNEGRDVGAVPGSIFDPLSVGCNYLLTQGATPITSAQALLTMLGDTMLKQSSSPATQDASLGLEMRNTQSQHSSDVSALLALCAEGATLDSLVTTTGIASVVLYQRLWDLQLEGLVEQLLDGRWISCIKK